MEEQWVVVVGEGTWVCISISRGLGLPCWCFVVESCMVVVREEEMVKEEGRATQMVFCAERGFRGDGMMGEGSGFMVQLLSASLML